MKNLILIGVATIGMALSVAAQSTIVGGYPIFYGSFQHQGPVNDSLTNAALNGATTVTGTMTVAGATTFSGGISTSTNTAALTRVANPLTSGGNYTNPPLQGFLRANMTYTNISSAWLTNITTGDVVLLGTVTTGTTTATNYANAIIRVGPGDVVLFTNIVGNPVLLSSEWRN